MRITTNNIQKAIKEATGLDILLVRGEGYFFFASDSDVEGLHLAGVYSTSVYTNHLTSFSIDRWVEEFKTVWNDETIRDL